MVSGELHIAVGVIVNDRNEILVARRPFDLHQGGLWEFPGGKVEAGENVREALARELYEELKLAVTRARPLIRIHYQYPEYPVLLDVWRVEDWDGEPFGREGQPIEWVPAESLDERSFPPANRAIISAVQLPPVYLITPDLGTPYDEFLHQAEACLRAGTRLIQLRCRRLMPDRFRAVVRELRDLCQSYNASLLLNAMPAEAIAGGADGIHLPSARLLQLNERPLDGRYLIGASCHNRTEVEHACRLGLDFIVLSPIQPTSSHPDATPLGWDGLRWLTECSTVPVYALGGMRPDHLTRAWDGGAQGVAMLSSVWEAADPARVIRACLD
ncbi:MAG: Nudix family hydrolase [Gammaproteobacteria bacterium]|nr:Nudix family hydrolase [Gammaproteobacteria bacterium]